MRDVVSSLTATALIQASNIASGVLLARFLQPEGRGELAAVMLWPTVIAIIGVCGLHEAVAYHMARRRHGAHRILRESLLLGAGLCLLLLPVGGLVVELLFAGRGAGIHSAALLYLAFIPLNFVGLFLVAAFQGGLLFSIWNLLRASLGPFYLLFILALHFAGFGGVFGFALASLLANAAMILLAAALYLRKRTTWPPPQSTPASGGILRRDLLSYGISVHFGTAVAFVAERLDQMIISIILPAADLGLFVIATTLSRLPLVFASTMATVSFPKIASMADEASRAAVFGRYARITSMVVLPASLALAAVMPWLLPLFFGRSFAAAVPIAWVQIAAAVPLSLKVMMSGGFKACDKGWIAGQAEIATLVLSAAALAALVPLYGLMGAAIAGVIAQTGALVFMAVKARQALGISPADLLWPRAADVALVREILRELRLRFGPRPAP